jgi:Zn-dependent protease/CBS domain-containing protein
MFAHAIRLLTVAGVPIRVDPSWLLLAALITWSLGGPTGYFLSLYPELAPFVGWTMGAIGALGLFACIVLHELAHALMAQRFDVHIRGITLFIFGGVAEMADEPPSPRAEFLVAVAGPLASALIGVGCFGAGQAGSAAGWPTPIHGVLSYLAILNLALVVFNLVPAFPLDGGRMLRAALWRWRGDLGWATGITTRIGGGFGLLLMALGVVGLFQIGLFLRNAAQASRRQQVFRRMLEGERVRDFMVTDPVVVPRHLSVREFVDDYVYRHHHKVYPVEQDGQLLGCITVDAVKDLPREEWDRQTVGRLIEPCGAENTVSPDEDALRALATMHRTGNTRMLVVKDGRLVGLVALKDLLKLLALKVELEDPAERPLRKASD